LDEWRSDSRIFWFGRATYAYGIGDWTAIMLLGEEGKLQSSLRRGDTHNMITDLLVSYGLYGLILYFATVLSFLYLLWVIRRSEHTDELGKTMALIVLVQMGYTFGYGLIAGSQFPALVAWLYIVLVAWLYHQHQRTLSDAPRPSIQPRRFDPVPLGGVVQRPVVRMGS
jgi:O-antigen ligase